MAYTQGIISEIGQGFREFNKGTRAVRHWMFPKRRAPSSPVKRRRKISNRIPPPNNMYRGYVPRNMVSIERKSVESDPTTPESDYSDDLILPELINKVAEGTGINQRVGRKIQLGTFSMKYTITSAANFSSAAMRIMVIYDKQSNGTLFTSTDIFQQSGYPATAYYNLNNRDRFLVLKDIKLSINPISSSQTSKYTGSFGLNLKMLPSTYNTTTGIYQAVTTGALFLVIISSADNTGADNTKPHTEYFWRLRYYDA